MVFAIPIGVLAQFMQGHQSIVRPIGDNFSASSRAGAMSDKLKYVSVSVSKRSIERSNARATSLLSSF